LGGERDTLLEFRDSTHDHAWFKAASVRCLDFLDNIIALGRRYRRIYEDDKAVVMDLLSPAD
jgi:hypothetical protein